MNEFSRYHPIVNFAYFVFVIVFSCFFMHPLCLAVSLMGGFTYLLMLKGKNAVFKNFLFMLFCFVSMSVVNPLFSHEGMTILAYFPSGNPLTFESVIYGICAGAMLVSVVCHFLCFNEVVTSDKIIYLFGKISPSLSLVISMSLRFVPKFLSQLKVVVNTDRCMGRGISNGGIVKRAKHGLQILLVMTTWALENAIETADSMKSRGYGLKGRTYFSVFTFSKRDKLALLILMLMGIYTFMGSINGQLDFKCYPSIAFPEISLYSVSVFVSYVIICFYPVIIEMWEVRRWKLLRSKI